MDTPEAIVIAFSILVFILVFLCACLLKSSLLEKLQQRLKQETENRQTAAGQTADRPTRKKQLELDVGESEAGFTTRETVLSD